MATIRRHQNDTKTFDELTFREQSLAMNATALNFRRQLRAHLRRAEREDRVVHDILRTRLGLLRKILADYPEVQMRLEIRSR